MDRMPVLKAIHQIAVAGADVAASRQIAIATLHPATDSSSCICNSGYVNWRDSHFVGGWLAYRCCVDAASCRRSRRRRRPPAILLGGVDGCRQPCEYLGIMMLVRANHVDSQSQCLQWHFHLTSGCCWLRVEVCCHVFVGWQSAHCSARTATGTPCLCCWTHLCYFLLWKCSMNGGFIKMFAYVVFPWLPCCHRTHFILKMWS